MRFVFLSLLLVVSAFSQSTIHILSPWANDTLVVTNQHHAIGAFSGWNPGSNTLMTNEGDGWFSYTINGDLTDWWDLTLRSCPVPDDQNCNGGLTWAIKPKVVPLLGGEPEVWVYPDSSTQGYTISLIPPGAKVVWFKSPWGNNSLPKMVIGTDTVAMHYATDPVRCGWFYGALRDAQITLGAVHFQRAFTETTLPAQGTVDLSAAIALGDSIFVDGTVSPLAPTTTAGTAGACFDSSKVVHILHPWPLDQARKVRPVYIHAGNLVGNYAAMLRDDSIMNDPRFNGWFRYSFPGTTDWSQNENLEFMSYNPSPENGRLTYNHAPSAKSLFPKGVYEIWLIPMGDSLKVLRAPVSPYFVQMRNPWANTVPKVIVAGDTISMFSLPDTCGWYRATLWENPQDWSIRFKQAIGFEFYTMAGLEDGPEIIVDSIMATQNSVWITPSPYPIGIPRVGKTYQGPPGDCPNRELAVMLFDWANSDPDFGKVYDGSDAADGGVKCPGLLTGIVNATLGPTGVPTKSDTVPAVCTAINNLHNWFLPQQITPEHSNATCYDLPLHLDDEGFWLADIAADSARGIQGFFPLDNFKFLDAAQAVPNPKYELEGGGSTIDGSVMTNHNFLFTMHVNATFVYVPGQYFEFRGDDDVWVFINDTLVVDLGGVHGPSEGSVDLDKLGLTAGNTYPFHIFFAERNCCGSNFKMRTSMDLKTDRAYYPIQIEASSGIIRYDIYQILREQSLSCDFSNSGAVDTVLAPSTFTLEGPQFPEGPVALSSGVNYGGVTIDANYTGFSIDTNAIIANRSLAPGQYTLTFTNSVDAALSSQVVFTVPTYPLPTITFTDSLGNSIDPDTVSLGEWAFVPYPVHVQAHYVGVPCSDCSDILQLTTADSLSFLDSLRNPITSVQLKDGRATFWVMGIASVDSAQFKVAGASVQNELFWTHIKLKEPPVPVPRYARMHDRNGDGVPDSLIFSYNRPLRGKDAPDSLFWKWGDAPQHRMDTAAIRAHLWKDSSVVLTGDSLVPGIFTGTRDGKPYSGSSVTWFTYLDEGVEVPFAINPSIEDHIGALITKAIIAPGDRVDTLEITLCESLADSQTIDSMFQLTVWRNGIQEAENVVLQRAYRVRSGIKYLLLYNNQARVIPTVGDSIRIVPKRGLDMSGNGAHAKNPKVRIIGRQRSRLDEISDVVVINPERTTEDSPVIIPILVEPGQTIEEIVKQEGMPGHLIHFDFANVLESSTTPLLPSEIRLEYESWYYSNLGSYVNHTKGSVSCEDEIFEGDCTKHSGDIFLGWSSRSKSGRLVGTGVYPVHFEYKILAGTRILEKEKSKQVWGLRRKK